MLVQQLPREARLVQVLIPGAAWGDQEHLLATVVDVLQAANWQRQRKGARPKPLPRPGQKNGKRMGQARPLHETQDLFDRWRSGRLHAKERGGSRIHARKGEVTHGRH